MSCNPDFTVSLGSVSTTQKIITAIPKSSFRQLAHLATITLLGAILLYIGLAFFSIAAAGVFAPQPGSQLTASSIKFRWTTETGATAYMLGVGTSAAAVSAAPWGDISIQAVGTQTSASVFDIPLNGQPIYVRLWYQVNAKWRFTDYVYQTVVGTQDRPAQLLSPQPPALLKPGVQFIWDSGHGVTQYWLALAKSQATLTQSPWADLFSYMGTATSAVVQNIPKDGSPVYARLWSKILDRWFYQDYSFQSNTAVPAQLMQPAPNSLIQDTSVLFTWNGGTDATEYMLAIASSQDKLANAGLADIYFYRGNNTFVTTPAVIPLKGNDIYVRLWSLIYGNWMFVDYRFPTDTIHPAELMVPAKNSVIQHAQTRFEWTSPGGATSYILAIASTPSALDTPPYGDIFVAQTTASFAEAKGLPLNGNRIYVRLWSKIQNVWFTNDYTYQMQNVTTATLSSPPADSPLTKYAQRFEWTQASPAATQYHLAIASDPANLNNGIEDIFSASTADNSIVATGIPLQGHNLYVRLSSLINGDWFFSDYVYSTVVSTEPPDPMAECQERGWQHLSVQVGNRTRDLLWKGGAHAWTKGTIIGLHGGGASYTSWCTEAVHSVLAFTEAAIQQGFGVLVLDSTNGVVTDNQGRSCGKRFDFASQENNVDLPFVGQILDSVIPSLRPALSNQSIFVTGLSSGGYMAIRASTHFDNKIAAFAPVSAGDPYGTTMVCDPTVTDREEAPGAFIDNDTGLPVGATNACVADPLLHEREWESSNPVTKPLVKQFHNSYDSVVNLSCMAKANQLLIQHNYGDVGALVIDKPPAPGADPATSHYWQTEYSQPMIDFFKSIADQVGE